MINRHPNSPPILFASRSYQVSRTVSDIFMPRKYCAKNSSNSFPIPKIETSPIVRITHTRNLMSLYIVLRKYSPMNATTTPPAIACCKKFPNIPEIVKDKAKPIVTKIGMKNKTDLLSNKFNSILNSKDR